MRSVIATFLLCPVVFICSAIAQTNPPSVKAESAVIMDAGTGKVLFSKNANLPLFPASTTKIMTALLLIEHCQPDEVITAPADIEKIKEASLHLKPGEKLKMKDMLYAILLRSANDACYAVALHIAGSVPQFAEMMNERAKAIGCTGTHFHNPNGLMDTEHKTTALDLARMGQEAMKNPMFRDAVRTYKKQISRSVNWQDTWMTNHNKLLAIDKTADGIKTGYTKPAGNCYVGSATRGGLRIITSLMKSDRASWQNDHLAMLDWAFKNFQKASEVPAGTIGSIDVKGSPVPVSIKEGTYVLSRRGAPQTHVTITLEPKATLDLPVAAGQEVGVAKIADSDGYIQQRPLYADQDVLPPMIARAASSSASPFGIVLGAGALGYMAYLMREKAKRIQQTAGMAGGTENV